MASFFDSGPLPDWAELRKWLGRDMPWNLVEQWDKNNDSAWLNDYVKQMMSQAKKERSVRTKNAVRFETLKDAKFVTITVHPTPGTDLHQLQLFATSERLKVLGLPDESRRSIKFPCPVYARSGKAAVKNERLVVRFKRRPPDKTEYELFIRS